MAQQKRFNRLIAYGRALLWIVENTPLLERIPYEAVKEYGSVGVVACAFELTAEEVARDVLEIATGQASAAA
jgi:hypothetical protein